MCAALVPILGRVQEVGLARNCIGSRGATLIANFLALNPCVKQLDLNENQLNDATKFAASLKTNTNLRKLTLVDNMITEKGFNSLVDAIVELNTGSLNGLVDCNHTCAIDILPTLNRHGNPTSNKLMKIVGAVEYCTEYIDEVPIELFPSLFALLQGGGIVKNNGDYKACSRCISLFVGGMRNCFTQLMYLGMRSRLLPWQKLRTPCRMPCSFDKNCAVTLNPTSKK